MRKGAHIAVALAVLALPAAAQQRDFSQVQVKATPVAGKVHMLTGAGGNIGVSVGPDGILIVDDQFAPLADKIRAALKGLGSGQLEFVLNTHWHGDHTGGNPVFGREATIVAHDNVRKRLSTEQTVFGETSPPAPPEALPVVTFGESLSIHFNGEEIRVVHYPAGHTDGDSIIFFTGSNVVHMGDDFFAGGFPFIDTGSGGSLQGLTENIADVISKLSPDVKIIPGHGPLSTLDDLKKYHRMLVETARIVRERIAAGQTLEQAKAAGLPEEWKPWGAGFIKTDAWITLLYESQAKPKAEGHGHGGHGGHGGSGAAHHHHR